jgi:ELWxxDGT repeat protein
VAGTGADLVANVRLAGSSTPLELTPVGGTVYFVADDGVVGAELWRSDGQPGGDYQLVDDFDSAATDSGVTGLAAFGNHVYFAVAGDTNGIELWRADESGAEIVKDINPVGNSSPANLTAIGNWLYFTAVTGAGRELWRSDGVPGGTTEMVADIDPGGSSMCGFPRFVALAGRVYFCADDGTSGRELWRTDIGGTGATRVADINPGPGGSTPSGMTVHGDAMYFQADDGTNGAELWALDTGAPNTAIASGPAAGTRIADRTPEFEAASGAIDLDRFECSAGGGSFEKCAGRDGAVTFPRLPDGQHSLSMRAVDVRDNADATPATVPLRIDGTAPKIVVRGRVRPRGERTARVRLLCKRSEKSGPCRGRATMRRARGSKAKLGKGRFRLRPGKAKRVKLKLTRRGRAVVAHTEDPLRIVIAGRARDALGNKRRLRARAKLVP